MSPAMVRTRTGVDSPDGVDEPVVEEGVVCVVEALLLQGAA